MRRLLPALFTVLASVLIAGYALLIPGELAALGASVKFSAFGFANVYFYHNTGYFDREADFLPLLHMWSLGVEEQFYLFWPIALGAILTFTRGSRLAPAILVGAVIVASIVLAQYQLATDPEAAFYLPFARAWELGVGAVLAFTPVVQKIRLSITLLVVGLLLIAGSILFIGVQHPFPGPWALPSVLGAALIVQPKAKTALDNILANRVMTRIGEISYSLYLWHWPVFVLYRIYISGGQPTGLERCLLCLVSVALAYLTWAFVERARFSKISTSSVLVGGTLGIVFFVGAGTVFNHFNGFPSRVSPAAMDISSREVMWRWDCPATIKVAGTDHQFCSFGANWETAKTHVVVWGDSHAQHLAPILNILGRDTNTSLLLQETCPAALGGSVYRLWPQIPSYPQDCRDIRQRMMDVLANNPQISTVVLPSAWATLSTYELADGTNSTGMKSGAQLIGLGLAETVRDIEKLGKRVVLVGNVPGPGWEQVACEFAATSGLLRRQCTEQQATIYAIDLHRLLDPTDQELSRIAKDSGAQAILPINSMCDKATCINHLDGQFIYRDNSHIRRNFPEVTNRHLATRLGLQAIFE